MAELRNDREQKTKTTEERASSERTNRGREASATAPDQRSKSLLRRYDYPTLISPFDMFRRMSRDIDRLFGVSPGTFAEKEWAPQVEMFERDGKLVVRADLPGLNKDDVKVELRDDVLTIEGERHSEREEQREGFFQSERSYGHFFRSIPLPEGTTGENCNASFRDGVLEVTMDAPKLKDRGARRIDIR